MIASYCFWKRLLTLSLMVFVVVITPAALSGCQPVDIESPPQPDVVTRALPAPAGASDSTEEPTSPSGKAERAAHESHTEFSPRLFTDFDPATSSTAETVEDVAGSGPIESDASQTLDSTLITAYDTLVEGEFFHTIPPYMNAGQQLVIRAGVSEEVNQKLLTSLNITETELVTIIGDKHFNPLRMELILDGAENEFLIESISDGIKLVIRDYPETWEWLVTPQKSGTFPLRLTALVRLDENQQGGSQQQELMLFSNAIPIRPVAGYTRQKIVRNYVIPFAVLSFFIFCIFIGWLIAYISHANHLGRKELSVSLQDEGINHEE